MSHRKPSPPLIVALVVAHLVVTTITWRDLSHRTADQIRGPRWLWRALTGVQMGNSAVYWLIGRKKVVSASPQP